MGIEEQKAQFIQEADQFLHDKGLLPEERSLANTGHNDELDAFRHAYVSGRFAQTYGGGIARLMGDYHEWAHPNEQAEQAMDKYNNARGIEYARSAESPDELLERVWQGMQDGELILKPGDKPRAAPDQYQDNQYGANQPMQADADHRLAALSPEDTQALRRFLTGQDHSSLLQADERETQRTRHASAFDQNDVLKEAFSRIGSSEPLHPALAGTDAASRFNQEKALHIAPSSEQLEKSREVAGEQDQPDRHIHQIG